MDVGLVTHLFGPLIFLTNYSVTLLIIVFLFFFQDRQLKIKDLVLSARERAVRNCPWTMGLWKSYLLALERHGAGHQTVTGTFKINKIKGEAISGNS